MAVPKFVRSWVAYAAGRASQAYLDHILNPGGEAMRTQTKPLSQRVKNNIKNPPPTTSKAKKGI